MSDEQIAEYLRARANVRPPMDLVASIGDAVADVPQQRHSWFAPFVPAAAAVAAAAVVLVAAVLVGQDPDAGPPPGGSPTQGETTSPSPSPSPSAIPAPTLLEAGDSVTLDAVDTDGRWGTVIVTRGEDLGGYDDGSVPAESFVIEIEVRYVAQREPNPLVFGAPDWVLVGEDDAAAVGEPVSPGGRREVSRPTLSTYPGAIDIFTNELRGWLLLAVPRDAEDQALELRYRPAGQDEVVVAMQVREAGAAPEPVAVTAPTPPELVTYVEREDYPFNVIDSAEADALFDTPDTCANPEAGYIVTYPDPWFTNTQIGDWAACSWFSPTFYDVGVDVNEVPPQIAIVGELMEGDSGSFEENLRREAVTVGIYPAVRVEDRGGQGEGGTMPPEWHSYLYQIQLGATAEEGPNLVFRVTTDMGGDYMLNKAVLDRIMALIQFGD